MENPRGSVYFWRIEGDERELMPKANLKWGCLVTGGRSHGCHYAYGETVGDALDNLCRVNSKADKLPHHRECECPACRLEDV